MSTDNETDAFELSDDIDDAVTTGAPNAFFGCYSVLSPGVEIILDGRAVSAPPSE